MRFMSVVGLIVLTAARAAAQEPDRWLRLTDIVGRTVIVTDLGGAEDSGVLLMVDSRWLELEAGGASRRIEAGSIARVQTRGDSVRNGALIGASIGLGMGLLSAGLADCPGREPGGRCPSARAGIVLFSTGVYAGVGALIDALRSGRTTIYRKPPHGHP